MQKRLQFADRLLDRAAGVVRGIASWGVSVFGNRRRHNPRPAPAPKGKRLVRRVQPTRYRQPRGKCCDKEKRSDAAFLCSAMHANWVTDANSVHCHAGQCHPGFQCQSVPICDRDAPPCRFCRHRSGQRITANQVSNRFRWHLGHDDLLGCWPPASFGQTQYGASP